jgi:hypothetical protein
MTHDTPNSIRLGDLFDEAELRRLMTTVVVTRRTHGTVNKALVPLLEPLMPRINQRTGQENDVRYIGYLIEAAYDKTRGRG